MGVQSLFGEEKKNRESREKTDNPEQERERGGRKEDKEAQRQLSRKITSLFVDLTPFLPVFSLSSVIIAMLV